jgi:mRNA-degrading endonuclease RelE of RelBE toxin-antitoxin system
MTLGSRMRLSTLRPFLKGTDRALRRRVGVWRVLFEVLTDRRIVVIIDVERRGSHTY